MGITVNQDDADQEDQEGASRLARLKAKIEAARQSRYIDLPVPELEPEIVVRYGTLSADTLGKISKRRRKVPLEARGFLVSCDVLATACLGIFERGADGELHADGELIRSEDGKPLTFATLNLAGTGKVVDEVQMLFVADGHLIATSSRVMQFSGYERPDVDEGLLGE